MDLNKSSPAAAPVLRLRICRQGFAKVMAGQVCVKYREAGIYWQRRLFGPDGQPKPFAAVHIQNGYAADAPLAVLEFRGILPGLHEHEGRLCHAIALGRLLQVQHAPSPAPAAPPLRAFADVLPTLPPVDHLAGLNVLDAQGRVARHIPAAPGQMGSLRVYYALALRFDGALSAEAARQGLIWFAEHTADARQRPGVHSNIDLLLAHGPAQAGWQLAPLPRPG